MSIDISSGALELCDAIERSDCVAILSLIARHRVDVNSPLPLPRSPTPLLLATDLGQESVVDTLLRAGARVNDTDTDGFSPCHAAAENGHLGVLLLLLARRPVLELADSAGHTPLDVALRSANDRRIVAMLIRAGAPLRRLERDDCQLLRMALSNVFVLRALIGRRFPLSSECIRCLKQPPLHYLASDIFPKSGCHPLLMSWLVHAAGVDLEARDVSLNTCSHIAAANGKLEHLRWFISQGADVDSRGFHGFTPLMAAARLGRVECVRLLLAAGARVDVASECTFTPCHWAVLSDSSVPEKSATSVIYSLLAGDADMDWPNVDGVTARDLMLHKGMSLNDMSAVSVVRFLIARIRLDLVRKRALQVCIGLQPLGLDANQMCEILQNACGANGRLIQFHQWWAIATTVKHFSKRER
jgi:ankyrin repeat protein